MSFKVLQWVFHQRWLTRFRAVHDRLMRGFAQLADKGDKEAQALYGSLLLHRGTDPSSRSAGARYLIMCADASRPNVCWQLHKLFEKGGVPGFNADADRAEHYRQLAAEGGHPLAQPDSLPL